MSLIVARKKRTALFLSIGGLLVMAAAVSAVSARDPDGVTLRVGMIMMTVGAALWLPWQALAPAALLTWLGPNYARQLAENGTLFGGDMMLELPGLVGLAAFAGLARESLRRLEDEDRLIGATNEFSGIDLDTGVLEARLLRPALDAELARSRRFDRSFALVTVGIDEMRQKFDYRDEETWQASFIATADLLRSTRNHIDRAYRFGETSFALILPESGEKEVTGLIRRLRRVARVAEPAEGEPGGPLPIHFGATFFPSRATTTDDLIRRAEIAMKVAEKMSSRVQIDGAEAPDLPPPETLRKDEPGLEVAAATLAAPAHTEEPVEEKRPGVIVPMPLPQVAAVATPAYEPAILRPVASLPVSIFSQAAPSIFATSQPVEEVQPGVRPLLEAVTLPAEPEVAAIEVIEVMAEVPAEPEVIVEAVAPAAVEVAAVVVGPEVTEVTVVAATVISEPEPVFTAPALPEFRPFVTPSLPVPAIVPAMETMQQPAALIEEAVVASKAPEPVAAAPAAAASAPAAEADDSLNDLMKHLDETLAMIRSLRVPTNNP